MEQILSGSAPINIFLMIFAAITSKLENVAPILSIHPYPPPLSKSRKRALLRFLLRGGGFCTQARVTDDRKQFQSLSRVLNIKTGLLFY